MLPALRLRTRLQLLVLSTAFISIITTGWLAYRSAKSSLEDVTFQRLTALRESKRRQIEYYFQRVETDIRSYAGDRSIVMASRELTRAFPAALSAAPAVEALLQRPGHGNEDRHVLAYRGIMRKHDDHIDRWRRLHGYYDVFIIDASSGDIVYTARKESDFASNLLHGPYSGSNLAAVFRLLLSDDDSTAVRFIDFTSYDPSGGLPAAFVATPVRDATGILAVLALQLSIDEINALMTASNVRAEGMGRSGETYIVGTDYLMRNDSRFFIEHPEQYTDMLLNSGTDTSVIAAIRNSGSSVLQQSVRTQSADAAMQGETDTRLVKDYRGVRVLSSFTPLSLPDLGWVMLSEIDETEAFRSVYELRRKLIIAGVVILLLASVLGVGIAQTVVRPILSLASVAARFGQGDFSQRASISSRDETGVLAGAFNTMAEEVQSRTQQLKDEIDVRINAEEELTRSKEELRNLSMHLQNAREAERKGFAREIHDELGQRLTTIKLQLSLLIEDIHNSDIQTRERLASSIDDVDATIQAVKRLISELRPGLLDDLGLTAAIEWHAEEFQRRTSIHCELSISPHSITLDQDRSIAVFRIFQETLTNVARHAGADSVTVFLTDNGDEIELVISDNGRGITREEIDDSRSFGLIGIRERAHVWGGTASVTGKAGDGTIVSVCIPKS